MALYNDYLFSNLLIKIAVVVTDLPISMINFVQVHEWSLEDRAAFLTSNPMTKFAILV